MQANNTPFQIKPLRLAVGKQGDFEKWENILTGAIDIQELQNSEEGTQKYIKYIKGMKTSNTILDWTQEEYMDG